MIHWIFIALACIMGALFGMRKSPLLNKPFNRGKLGALALTIVSIVLANFVVWHVFQ